MDSPTGGTVKKRRKGATRLSCAECRRLKLRCDRAIPCSSCVKRGCGAICPDGSLTTGLGNRFVLASTQELHEKITQLANRVRQLEDGLRASHAQVSPEQHPLLSDDLLKIKAPLQRDATNVKPVNVPAVVKEEENNPDAVDASGSLSIGQSGKTKFYGQTANSWLFLKNELEEEDVDSHHMNLQSILPAEILARASSMSVSSSSSHGNVGLAALCLYLPLPDIAMNLRTTYYTHAAWMYNPINVEWFDTEVYSAFYGRNSGPITDEPLDAHRLSLLFMVLAIGSLMNTALPAYNLDAEKYHQLARAALFHFSFLDNPTLHAIQSLFLMTYYMFLADRHGTNTNARWHTMGLAIKTAQSIGLHMDSGKFKVDTVETQRRRELFWELFTYDSWQSWTFGRPPSFAAPHFDTKMPFVSDKFDENSYNAWKHRFSSECMAIIHDQAFGAKTPTYATVLQLDRKLRAFPVPPILQVAGFGNSEGQANFPETVMLTLQRHIVLAIREMNLLYLHRSFFARAISDHPKDPLGSPYGTSVIAAYRSAGSLVAMMRNLHTQLKEPSERIWFLWTHMFSCAIILGSIVTRCPSMSLAPSALVQLDSACELFSKASHCFRATKVLDIMLQLQKKAHFSLEEFRRGKATPLLRYRHATEADRDTEDELSVLGGKTRLVSKKDTLSPILLQRSPISQNPIVPLPLSSPELAPDVKAYLRSFQPPNNGQTQDSEMYHLQFPQPQPSSPHNFANGAISPHDQRSSFVPTDMGQTSLYGGQPTYRRETIGYPQQQSFDQSMISPQNNRGLAIDTAGVRKNDGSFLQYFPVYDYGQASTSYTNGSTLYGNEQSLGAVVNSPVSAMSQHSRLSDSPDANNMQATWLDFVNAMAV